MITTDKIREAGIEQLFNASSFRETIPPRHYKRIMRHIRGQWMTITDRREQYYAKRKVNDDAINLLAESKLKSPNQTELHLSRRERMMQAQREYNMMISNQVESMLVNKNPVRRVR